MTLKNKTLEKQLTALILGHNQGIELSTVLNQKILDISILIGDKSIKLKDITQDIPIIDSDVITAQIEQLKKYPIELPQSVFDKYKNILIAFSRLQIVLFLKKVYHDNVKTTSFDKVFLDIIQHNIEILNSLLLESQKPYKPKTGENLKKEQESNKKKKIPEADKLRSLQGDEKSKAEKMLITGIRKTMKEICAKLFFY